VSPDLGVGLIRPKNLGLSRPTRGSLYPAPLNTFMAGPHSSHPQDHENKPTFFHLSHQLFSLPAIFHNIDDHVVNLTIIQVEVKATKKKILMISVGLSRLRCGSNETNGVGLAKPCLEAGTFWSFL
jgi:hypothetical protein